MDNLEAKLSLGIVQSQRTELRNELRLVWNERLQGPLAFGPSELREILTEQEVQDANREFGQFASSHLKEEFRNSTDRDRTRRRAEGSLVVGVGYGKGYDSRWVSQAAVAGLSTMWIDVSDVACEWARVSLASQWAEAQYKAVEEPIVIEGEVIEVLSGTADVVIDPKKIEILYLSRLLGCLKEDLVEEAVQLWGRSLSAAYDSGRNHRIILVAAFKEDNLTRVGKTSRLYERKMVLANLEMGAVRKIEVVRESTHYYFGQFYVAMTIMAKPIGEEK